MNTRINIQHIGHPDDERILQKLESFDENSNDGFLRLEDSDRVFVILDSEAHKKLQTAVSESKAFSLGVVEHNSVKFAEYSVNESFFKS